MQEFDGKVVLVTGFGSGIGRAVAVAFAAQGARVVGLSRRTGPGEEVAAQIKALGGEALFMATDVGDAEAVQLAVGQAITQFGGIDVAVNSAGIRLTGTATSLSVADWDAVIRTNLTGSFLVSRAVIATMGDAGGTIINISANSGFRGTAGRVAYSVSKGAIHNLTEAMALDHAADGIRVNCIAPGPTATAMLDGLPREMLARLDTTIPLGKIGEAEQVASAALFLASDAAAHITGAILPVNGGAHL
ncbi:MAG TPA: short chain dehydrogenase [Gammaproteobacteria bacterium]|nr:short chain dehydrogenase [Gammaproteobacteria bacterium]